MIQRGRGRARRDAATPDGARSTTLSFVATVPIGGEPIAVRELTELGTRARTLAPGRIRFTTEPSGIASVLARARCITSLTWVIGSGTAEELREIAASVPWRTSIPEGSGIALDTSLEFLRDAIPSGCIVADVADPACVGRVQLESTTKALRKGSRIETKFLHFDLLLDRDDDRHAVIAIALRYASIPPGTPLAIFGEGVFAAIREVALFARAGAGVRSAVVPGARWLPFSIDAGEVAPPPGEPDLDGVVAFESDLRIDGIRSKCRAEVIPLRSETEFVPFTSTGESSRADGNETIVHLFSDPREELARRERLVVRMRTARRARHVIVSRSDGAEPGDAFLTRAGVVPVRTKMLEIAGAEWCVSIVEPDSAKEPIAAKSSVPARAAQAVADIADPDERRFVEILAENARLRRRWPKTMGTDAYRLYDRAVDSIPLVVDRYADALHITIYPPDEPQDLVREARWIHRVGETLGVDPTRVFVKRKERRARGVQHEVQAREGARVIVSEGGVRLIANLSDYVDTGLFLDHRDTRAEVRKRAKGKRLLNLFCYTGAFTVAAAAGGARATTSVDTSQTYLDWARENLRANGLENERHRLVRRDALDFLREPTESGEHGAGYDLAVVDPPTRSNRRRGSSVWDVQRDHVELLELLRPLLAPRGRVLFSTNFRRFQLETDRLEAWRWTEITPASIPSDIGDRRIHRAWWFTSR
ncbi:MAG: class I SAM-dependent methyltransferase [Planctomycetes bacterium]|nr:class I SAM-dependent methyltransferase [Planctomycetota bacterium]